MKIDDFSNLLQHILCSIEDDYYGLYEIVWTLNSVFPDVSSKIKEDTAREIVREMLQRGWVYIFDVSDPDREPISKERHEETLMDPQSWIPSGEEGIWISTTELGDEVYYKQ